ncbi:hypothetical protein K438DRAFT_1972125 [Mycena galopus ATCC 62051]|nr:hypothetical protein K438DRAFT_1972125 [Mycena galopus ATCC 62051]
MGQGGTIILSNDTPVVLNNINQKSAGMNWNFPASIANSVQQYVEFVGSPYLAWTDWQMAGLNYNFRIIVQGQYNIRLLNESVPSSSTPIGNSIAIPWKHNGVTVIRVVKNADATYTFAIN